MSYTNGIEMLKDNGGRVRILFITINKGFVLILIPKSAISLKSFAGGCDVSR